MNGKIILVILQALSYDAATARMSYMNELVSKGKAQFYKVDSDKTSFSKSLQEDVLQGNNFYVNAMLNHQILKKGNEKNIFQLVRENGLKTGAAAYYWISRMYDQESLEWQEHEEKIDESSNIQYATYYGNYSYRDSDVFTDSEYIRKKYNPNLLLVHSMGIAHVSLKYGAHTQEYYNKISEIDSTLELIIPMWQEAGYDIIVTTEQEISIAEKKDEKDKILPLWAIGEKLKKNNLKNQISQVGISGVIYEILNIKKPEKLINCHVNGSLF